VPPSAETIRQSPNILDVQERARGPLSPYQVWWGSDFTLRRGRRQTLSFFLVRLFVCLSVRPPFERQSLFALFRHQDVGEQKRF